VAALSREPAITFSDERTKSVVNSRITPTPAFQRNPDLRIDEGSLLTRIRKLSQEIHAVDATGLGQSLLGDSIAANLFLLGHACQLGLLPVGPEAILKAIEINDVAVPFNKSAFALGRLQAVDPQRVAMAAAQTGPSEDFKPLENLEEILAHRTALLTAYMNKAYAERYRNLVDRVAEYEKKSTGGTQLSIMVARNFARLMAYKDEYEVGRLHSDPAFKEALRKTFADGARLRYNLAPPLFSKRDPATGHLLKREFGAWVEPLFGLLARLKVLRGTPFDLFGYSAERKMERNLIDHYETQMRMVAENLNADNYTAAVELASLPALVRGFGHVKEANYEKMKTLEISVLEKFRNAKPKITAKVDMLLA